MEEILSPIVVGGLAGYFVGALVKWFLHLAFIIGVFIFLLFHMTLTDVINLNLDELAATIGKYAEVLTQLGFTALASNTPFVGSFMVGLILGLRR